MDRTNPLLPSARVRSRRAAIVLLVGAALAVGLLASVSPVLGAQLIVSAGPLTRVEISTDLNCTVDHTGDISSEFFGQTACGTLVAVGGTLFGPASIPAGGSAAPRTAFTPVSQSAVLGSGTSVDPYRIVTVVGLGATGLQITETDSYIVGLETYRTDVVIGNSGSPANAILYRAGDCFLQNSDQGFGAADANGAVSCVAGVDNGSGTIVPGTRIEQWFPLSAGSSYYESDFNSVWAKIGTQTAFANSCEQCANYIDNGAGLSWNVTIPTGGSVTRSHLTVFSPLGIVPLTTTKTAAQPSVAAGASDSYTITIANPNNTAATLTSITDTLPAGFTYSAGSTTGATTSDPGIVGQVLTWSGPFTVPASSSISLTFGVTVSSTPGTYMNQAGGTAEIPFVVVGSGETAPVTVGAGAGAHLTLTKTIDNTGGGTALVTDWTLSATGPTPITGHTGDAAITNAAVDPGTYALAETGGPTGYSAGAWSCSAGTLTGSSLLLAAGESASCSIKNTFIPPAHLTLTKTIDNTGGGTALVTAWTLSATGPTPITGHTGDAAITNAAVDPGTYALAETGGPTGYSAGAWSCSAGTLTGSSLLLAAGESASCSIKNTFIPPGRPGLIAPSETSCEQYLAGTAPTLPGVNYSDKAGKIGQNINPGIFFYFSTVTVTAGQAVTTSQTTTSSSGSLFLLNNGHAFIWDSACKKVGLMASTNGGATGSFTFPTAGMYVLQLQYHTKSLAQTTAPSPINPTYTFDTKINGVEVVSDATSISLVKI